MKSNIKDVARRAGVSIATVSHVINNTHFVSDEKRHRILSAIKGLNYKPNVSARNLRVQKVSLVSILVCDLYSAGNPRMLPKTLQTLIDTLEVRGYSAMVHFVNPKSVLDILDSQADCMFSFLITDNAEIYGHVDHNEHNIFFIDMGRMSLGREKPDTWQENRFHYAAFYYFTWLANFISDHTERNFCTFMPREDLQILKELYSRNVNYENIFERIRGINSEMSEAHIELSGILENSTYDSIYLTDYKFALGAVRLLLLKPELSRTRTDITFFSYDCSFESFNLLIKEKPFYLSASSMDDIVVRANELQA